MPRQILNHTGVDISSAVSDADLVSLDRDGVGDSHFTAKLEREFADRDDKNERGGRAFSVDGARGPAHTARAAASRELPPVLEPDFDEGPEALMAVSNIEQYSLADEEVSNHRPVPRISIHVFCETPNVAGLIQSAGRDRRLSKANVELFDGGIRSAVSYYSQTATPNLLIIESYEKHRSLIELLNELSMVCDPSTKVVVVGAANDVRLYRDLMKRGISEYLVSPRSPRQIISTISDLYTDPGAEPIGRTYAFIGSRGGAGSSVLSHNVAWALAERYSNNTVLVDLDLPFGTASLDFEHDATEGLAEALAAPERLDLVLLDSLLKSLTDKLSIFTAPNILDKNYEGNVEGIESIIDVVRNAVPSIVIDVPHSWSPVAQYSLHTADEIIITCTPDLASFKNVKNIFEHLKSTRINDSPPLIIMNQVGMNKASEVPIEQFSSVLGVSPFVTIPWDPSTFGLASTNGVTVFETNGKSKTAAAMAKIAAHLSGNPVEGAEMRNSSLMSLLRKN